MHRFRIIVFTALLAFTASLLISAPDLHAETSAVVELNPRLVRLGDTFTVEIRILSDEQINLMAPAFPTPDGVSLGIRSSSQEFVQMGGEVTNAYIYTAVYNTIEAGNIEIGPFRVNYADPQGEPLEIVLNAIIVEIYEDAPAPSSEIVPGVSPGWLQLIIVLASLAILAGLIYAWVRLHRRKPADTVAPITSRRRSPEDEALDEIKNLDVPRADDDEAVKAYYDRVDVILKDYIYKRYTVSTRDNTLWEIKQEFHNRQRIDSRVKGLFLILNDCDWVKYAKTHPTDADIRLVVGRCSDSLKGVIIKD